MKPSARWNRIIVGLTCIGLVLPTGAANASPPSKSNEGSMGGVEQAIIQDVALGSGGVLEGVAFNGRGEFAAGVPVSLGDKNQELAETVTDPRGRFTFTSARGGVFQVQSPGGTQHMRLWAPNTAPPGAKEKVVVVLSDEATVVRGQNACGRCGASPCCCKLIGPALLLGAAGLAVGIVALTDDDGGGLIVVSP